MNNLHTDWTQSRFIYKDHYGHYTMDQLKQADRDESLRVKDHVKGNHICTAISPDSAKWIASRLNLAAKLEQMTYDFATGKTDGEEIVKMVQDAVNS